jgi:hypothetical protein
MPNMQITNQDTRLYLITCCGNPIRAIECAFGKLKATVGIYDQYSQKGKRFLYVGAVDHRD